MIKRFIQFCLLGGAIVMAGCGQHESTPPTDTAAAPTIYTCSMHPQIQQDRPGNCPICGMKLVTMEVEYADNARELNLSPEAVALANIQTTEVTRSVVDRDIDLFGLIATDDTRVATVTARFPGRIERLFVNFVGTSVRKGEHLAEIYSDELVEAQSELIGALRYDTNKASADGIKERLRLWDIPEDQIELIESTGKPVYRVRIDSPTGGIVTQLDVREGDYVATGSRLFEVTDLSKLWVHFDAYETDLNWLRYGQSVRIRAKAYPGEEFVGTIAFIQPMLDPQTRTVKVRVNVNNPDGKLRPGMYVRGIVSAHLGSGGKVIAPELAGKWIGPMHPEIISDEPGNCPICGMALEPASDLGYAAFDPGNPPLLVPTTAVLRTGERAVVYVQEGEGQFVGREIILGPRANDYFVVQSGLNEGDMVVTNGAFRIDSELQIRAKPSMMNPDASSNKSPDDTAMDMPGDKNDKDRPLGEAVSPATQTSAMVDITMRHQRIPQQFDVSADFNDSLNTALQSYLKLKSDFDQNDFTAAQAAAAALVKGIQNMPMAGVPQPAMKQMMTDQADAERSAKALSQNAELNRVNGIDDLSEALIDLVQTFKWHGETPLYLMYCPMAHGDNGARWLQNTPELTNPYFGPDMLGCGEVLAVWNNGTARWDAPK